jgi:hypothetical protein
VLNTTFKNISVPTFVAEIGVPREIHRPGTKSILSANQLFLLIDMKRKFVNSDNHKFHQYQ